MEMLLLQANWYINLDNSYLITLLGPSAKSYWLYLLQAGGLDLLTLDSLYNEANRQAQQAQQSASYNPWETTPASGPMMHQPMYDPFYASNSVAAARNVQMAAMAQQQHAFMLPKEQQRQMMVAQQQQASSNPFASPYMHTGVHPYSTGMQLHAGNAYTGTGMM